MTTIGDAVAISPTDAAAAAKAAFATGRTVPLQWRREQLQALDRLLADNVTAFETALKADLGKHPLETHSIEVGAVRSEIKLALRNLAAWTKPHKVPVPLTLRPGAAWTVLQPLGTVLIISPWNYPVYLLLKPFIGALAAGDAAVLKPSELAPATSHLLARLVPEYLDPQAVQVVEGGIPETTELLALRWDHIFYTGNGTVGRIVAAAAAKHLTPVTLELGGKSPTWVDESADIDAAARWLVWGKFLNAGQTCIAPDYVLATPRALDPLVAALGKHITAMYGSDPQRSADLARIVDTRHVDRLARLAGSGTTAIGGQISRDDRYVAPTVLRDVSADDPVMQEEIFGPILPIVTVPDADAAIDLINGRDKPLALYCFTQRSEVRDAFLARTTSGGVSINSVMLQLAVPGLPFGGVGASGSGAYSGEHSIRTFSHERSVMRKLRGPDLTRLGQPPFTERKERMLRGRGSRTS